jgi:hypothetical protein
MRSLASAALLLIAIGCTPTAGDLSKSLHDGQSALQAMAQAAVERNYDEYFRQYEVLRQCYINIAAILRGDHAQADHKEILHTLQQWETAIATARAAWANLNSPPKVTLDVEIQRETPPELLQRLEKLDDESHQARERINKEWAPLELRLDDAISEIRALRSE